MTVHSYTAKPNASFPLRSLIGSDPEVSGTSGIGGSPLSGGGRSGGRGCDRRRAVNEPGARHLNAPDAERCGAGRTGVDTARGAPDAGARKSAGRNGDAARPATAPIGGASCGEVSAGGKSAPASDVGMLQCRCARTDASVRRTGISGGAYARGAARSLGELVSWERYVGHGTTGTCRYDSAGASPVASLEDASAVGYDGCAAFQPADASVVGYDSAGASPVASLEDAATGGYDGCAAFHTADVSAVGYDGCAAFHAADASAVGYDGCAAFHAADASAAGYVGCATFHAPDASAVSQPTGCEALGGTGAAAPGSAAHAPSACAGGGYASSLASALCSAYALLCTVESCAGAAWVSITVCVEASASSLVSASAPHDVRASADWVSTIVGRTRCVEAVRAVPPLVMRAAERDGGAPTSGIDRRLDSRRAVEPSCGLNRPASQLVRSRGGVRASSRARSYCCDGRRAAGAAGGAWARVADDGACVRCATSLGRDVTNADSSQPLPGLGGRGVAAVW